jgi:HEAT repeat protein
LIDRVGEPFIAPILDRLAEEQSMSLRRYFMERLHKIGPAVKDAAIPRLRDSRWYFVRNLILVLRDLDDPLVIQHIRRLTRHPHTRVRQEAVRTLLHFRDPEADTQLLRDMADSDREVLINAVRLAEHSKNPAVLKHLIRLLSSGGLTGFDYELKSAAIHSLGMIGNPTAIPELEQFLKSRTFFRTGQLNRLKSETVQSLKHYPSQSVIGLLRGISKSGQSEIRQIAEEIYRNLLGGDRES